MFTHLIGLVTIFLSYAQVQDSTFIPAESGPEEIFAMPSQWHVLASTFGTIGGYSTGTDSRSVSGYATLTNAWRDYYTIGYAALWLERSDAGGKYYSQQLISARTSWFLTDRISFSIHYALLSESEIQFYSNSETFHWAGAGASYWFSPFQFAGGSFSLSLFDGKVVSGAYRGAFSFNLGNGIWLTSTAVISDAEWTPLLFSFRQSVSIPLGDDSYIIGSGDVGRRGFYFDDESLIVYNQRSVQTGSILIKGVVHILSGFYLLPSIEYNPFDEFNVKYGSLGIRAVF